MLAKYIVLPEKSAYSKIFSVKPDPIASLWLFLHTIPDFRRGQGMRHELPVILLLSILALCCGHLSYEAMEEWCENYQEMIKTHIPFLAEHMPVAATFHRVFTNLNSEAFEEVLGNWLQQIIPTQKGEGIAIDGKSLHGTTFHLVSAFAHAACTVLFQMGTETKGKELVVGPKVLKYLHIQDRVITGDALFAQRLLCVQITTDGGGYVLRVKGNQETLERDIRFFFADPPFHAKITNATITDDWKGQTEIREVFVSSDPELLSYLSWPGLTHIWQMKKTVTKQGKITTTVSVGIARITKDILGDRSEAQAIAEYIRGHWGIENRLHRTRDTVFNEDHATIRKGNGPQIMAALKNLVISIFHRGTVRSFTKALRRFAIKPLELFDFLGITQQVNIA
jgi:predicted transposase YbfD/YdcC